MKYRVKFYEDGAMVNDAPFESRAIAFQVASKAASVLADRGAAVGDREQYDGDRLTISYTREESGEVRICGVIVAEPDPVEEEAK